MRIKTYFSGTVEAAIALARQEIGDDALLLSSQVTRGEATQFGAYEVTFAYEPSVTAQPHAETFEPAEDLATFLASRDLSPALVKHLGDQISSAEVSEEDISRAIERVVKTATPDPSVPAMAFVGPTGSGKTLSLLKVAIREKSRPVRILSIDSGRPGGDRQLHTLSAIAGIPCRTVQPSELSTAILPDALYLIDTPGSLAPNSPAALSLAENLRKIAAVFTHLVVTATTRTADLALTAERFQMFQPKRLLFTRLDETTTTGGIVSLAYSTGLPVSWLGNGQSLTNHLLTADSRRIAAGVLTSQFDAVPEIQRAAAGATR